MSRTEPDIPSIHTPLAHEQRIREQLPHEQAHNPNSNTIEPERHEQLDPAREPGNHRAAVAVLGPPTQPGDPAALVWARAAAAIENYRTRYQLPNEEPGLGAEPRAGAFQQRLHRRQAAIQVQEALDQLDRPMARDKGLELQTRHAQGADADRLERGERMGTMIGRPWPTGRGLRARRRITRRDASTRR